MKIRAGYAIIYLYAHNDPLYGGERGYPLEKQKMPNRGSGFGKTLLVYAVIIACICFVVFAIGSPTKAKEPDELTYSELLTYVENDLRASRGETVEDSKKTVRSVILVENELIGICDGSTIPDSAFSTKNYDFHAVLPSANRFYEDIAAIYETVSGEKVSPSRYAFTFETREPNAGIFWQILPSILSLALFVFFVWFMLRAQRGQNNGMNGFVRGRTKLTDPAHNKIRYTDVAGEDEEKEELKEVVDFLKAPEKYTKVGAKIPKGVLLIGPPGTGKTLLAKAVAGEAGVPFYTISGSEFMEMYVGVGASRVRDLFDQAKKAAPSIVFIDEIDAIGRQRGAGLGGGHDEREQTLNQLLVEMDGFNPNEGVIVMAATNRSDILDPALLRPGRFDRQVLVNYPDVKGREEILKVHSRNKPLASDVDLHSVAVMTPGCAGADLANILNEAALLTARKNEDKITMRNIEEAINRVEMGIEKKSHVIPEKDKEMVAYHEGGHAIVAYLIPECEKVQEITTIPRGMAGGYTKYLPDEKTRYYSASRLKAHIASAMGGLCAEELVYGEATTGAQSDLKGATGIARAMVTEYGMSELGPIYMAGEHEVFLGRTFSQTSAGLSEKLNAEVDTAVRKFLDEGKATATRLLSENREKLDGLVKLLMEKERLNREEFESYMEDRPYDAARAEALRYGKDVAPAAAEPEAEPEQNEEA